MLELSRHKKVKKLVYLSSMEQYGVPYESGQVMTEERLGYLDHLNVRSSYSEVNDSANVIVSLMRSSMAFPLLSLD